MIKLIRKGFEGEIKIADSEEELKDSDFIPIQSCPVSAATSLDSKFVVGLEQPYGVAEGAQSYTGSITRPLVDTTIMKFAGIPEVGYMNPPHTSVIGIFPNKFKTGESAIILKGVKWGSYSSSLAPDDIIDETLDWSAESLEYKDCEDVGYVEYYEEEGSEKAKDLESLVTAKESDE